jgi:hypothetical protein
MNIFDSLHLFKQMRCNPITTISAVRDFALPKRIGYPLSTSKGFSEIRN